MTMTIGDIEFDNVSYDADADVLYLHVGDPTDAVDFGETPEGHGARFDAEGELVGLTLVRPKHLLATQGSVRVTVPRRVTRPSSSSLEADELAPVLG